MFSCGIQIRDDSRSRFWLSGHFCKISGWIKKFQRHCLPVPAAPKIPLQEDGATHLFIVLLFSVKQCISLQGEKKKKEEALILGYISNQYGFYFSNKKLGDLVPLPNASLLKIMHPSEYLRLSPSPGKVCGATQHIPSHLLGSTLEEFSCMSQRWRLHQHTGNEKQQVCETSVPTSHISLRDIFSR